MTAQQSEHCEHESMCWQHQGHNPCSCNKPALMKCEHDTRPRPHTPAPLQITPNGEGYTLSQIVEINENIKKQRAEASRTVTLKVLDETIADLEKYGLCETPESQKMFSISVLKTKRQSVRRQQEGEQE
jgi:hypothetical protein